MESLKCLRKAGSGVDEEDLQDESLHQTSVELDDADHQQFSNCQKMANVSKCDT